MNAEYITSPKWYKTKTAVVRLVFENNDTRQVSLGKFMEFL